MQESLNQYGYGKIVFFLFLLTGAMVLLGLIAYSAIV